MLSPDADRFAAYCIVRQADAAESQFPVSFPMIATYRAVPAAWAGRTGIIEAQRTDAKMPRRNIVCKTDREFIITPFTVFQSYFMI
jgi:hypothetical protein